MRDEENVALGLRLRHLRQAHGLTQAAIGERVGATMNRWNNWEVGVGRIPVPEATKLVQAYGVTLDWIYLGKEAGMPFELMMKIRGIA